MCVCSMDSLQYLCTAASGDCFSEPGKSLQAALGPASYADEFTGDDNIIYASARRRRFVLLHLVLTRQDAIKQSAIVQPAAALFVAAC
jgi:hypothetical protein